jgi:heme oxygenase
MERDLAKTNTAVEPTAATNGVLERVRRRTQDVHRSLEELPIWEAAFSNVRAYAALLDGFLSLVRPADAAIAMTLGAAAPEGFSATVRADWLESDRRSIADGQRSLSEIDPVGDDPLISGIASNSLSAAAGTLYVIEGSALGGRILSRRLQESLGIDPSSGGRYFFGHGAETAVRWRQFLEWLDALQLDQAGAEAAASTARSVFERFRERLATLRYD